MLPGEGSAGRGGRRVGRQGSRKPSKVRKLNVEASPSLGLAISVERSASGIMLACVSFKPVSFRRHSTLYVDTVPREWRVCDCFVV